METEGTIKREEEKERETRDERIERDSEGREETYA